jgi:hypothetical protein
MLIVFTTASPLQPGQVGQEVHVLREQADGGEVQFDDHWVGPGLWPPLVRRLRARLG